MVENGMRPIHPGEVLLEEYLEPLEMTPHALAVKLRISAPRVSEIVKGDRSITVDTALRLSRFFGTSPEFWLNLQAAYDLKIAQRAEGDKICADITPLVSPEPGATNVGSEGIDDPELYDEWKREEIEYFLTWRSVARSTNAIACNDNEYTLAIDVGQESTWARTRVRIA